MVGCCMKLTMLGQSSSIAVSVFLHHHYYCLIFYIAFTEKKVLYGTLVLSTRTCTSSSLDVLYIL